MNSLVDVLVTSSNKISIHKGCYNEFYIECTQCGNRDRNYIYKIISANEEHYFCIHCFSIALNIAKGIKHNNTQMIQCELLTSCRYNYFVTYKERYFSKRRTAMPACDMSHYMFGGLLPVAKRYVHGASRK